MASDRSKAGGRGSGEEDVAFRVVIAGGGVAALEALLALRDLLGPRVRTVLLAPEREFVLKPLAVAEPFGHPAPPRFSLPALVTEADGDFSQGTLAEVDPERQVAITGDEHELHYDALLVALGAHAREALPGSITYRGPGDNAAISSVVAELEQGTIGSLAFAVPTSVRWAFPLYELALLTASRLRERGHQAPITLATHEPGPLAAFGSETSEALREQLREAGVDFHASAGPARVEPGRLLLLGGESLAADRVVSLPRLEVPPLPGVPQGPHGFIGTDGFMRVEALARVWAAGDATWFPIKQGGLAAQQADVAAASIANLVDPEIEPVPFRPVLRGALLGGATPRYMRAEIGHAEDSSATATAPLWWPASKVAARHLAPFLAARAGGANQPLPPLEDVGSEAGERSRVERDHADAVALALTAADADARWGDFHTALRWLEVVEALELELPSEYEEKRGIWIEKEREHHGRRREPPPAPRPPQG